MKTTKRSNFRVEVYPTIMAHGFQIAEEEDVCKVIMADIKRHVDNKSGVVLVCDSDPVCSHCGSQWTEDGDAYNGGCCDMDQEDFRAEIVKGFVI